MHNQIRFYIMFIDMSFYRDLVCAEKDTYCFLYIFCSSIHLGFGCILSSLNYSDDLIIINAFSLNL